MHPALNEIVTLEKLKTIQAAASEMIGDKGSLIEFNYTPLIETTAPQDPQEEALAVK